MRFVRLTRGLGTALLLMGATVCDAPAQTPGQPGAPDLMHGALLFHGNYCGAGNRGPHAPPVDALDRACMHHDACTPSLPALPSCACNARLRVEAGLVARNPRQPEDLRTTAQSVSDGATLLPCQPGRPAHRATF